MSPKGKRPLSPKEELLKPLGTSLLLDNPMVIQERIDRIVEYLDRPSHAKRDRTPLEVIIRSLEGPAKQLLRDNNEDDDASHTLQWEEEIYDDKNPIDSAKSVVNEAFRVRSRVEDGDWIGAIIRMMLLTASSIRMQFQTDAWLGVRMAKILRDAGRRSAQIRSKKVRALHQKIVRDARGLKNDSVPQREWCSILAERHSLSPNHVREILKKGGAYRNKVK